MLQCISRMLHFYFSFFSPGMYSALKPAGGGALVWPAVYWVLLPAVKESEHHRSQALYTSNKQNISKCRILTSNHTLWAGAEKQQHTVNFQGAGIQVGKRRIKKEDPENILPYITVKSVLGCSVVHNQVHQASAWDSVTWSEWEHFYPPLGGMPVHCRLLPYPHPPWVGYQSITGCYLSSTPLGWDTSPSQVATFPPPPLGGIPVHHRLLPYPHPPWVGYQSITGYYCTLATPTPLGWDARFLCSVLLFSECQARKQQVPFLN